MHRDSFPLCRHALCNPPAARDIESMAETLRPPNTTDEIESMTDSFFQRVYTGEQSIDEVCALR